MKKSPVDTRKNASAMAEEILATFELNLTQLPIKPGSLYIRLVNDAIQIAISLDTPYVTLSYRDDRSINKLSKKMMALAKQHSFQFEKVKI